MESKIDRSGMYDIAGSGNGLVKEIMGDGRGTRVDPNQAANSTVSAAARSAESCINRVNE